MQINFENKQQTMQDLKDNIYLVACVSRRGDVVYVGTRNRVGFGAHEPLLQNMGGGSIDDYWRYTFNAQQGAAILFTIPKYSGKQINPSDKATEEVHEAAYDARRYWETLANQLSQETGIKISTEYDIIDSDGLFTYYKAQIMKGLIRQAQQQERRQTPSSLEDAQRIRNFVRRLGKES